MKFDEFLRMLFGNIWIMKFWWVLLRSLYFEIVFCFFVGG